MSSPGYYDHAFVDRLAHIKTNLGGSGGTTAPGIKAPGSLKKASKHSKRVRRPKAPTSTKGVKRAV